MNTQQKKRPVLWSIAGSDSSGGTGIQADLHTFESLGGHGCSVITALTAQNSFALGYSVATERKNVVAQINALDSDMPAAAIKLGMLANTEIVETIIKYLNDYTGFVVYDPIMDNCDGGSLLDEAADLIKNTLLPRIDLLTPNLTVTRLLSGICVDNAQSMVLAGNKLLAMGTRSVLITGAQFDDMQGKRVDYWSDGDRHLWLSGDDIQSVHDRGSGCVLSSAATAGIGAGLALDEALILAKSYVTQGIRGAVQLGGGPGAVAHLGWPEDPVDIPETSQNYPGMT